MNNSSHIIFILDKSGSMATIKDDTIKGMNHFALEVSDDRENCTMSLTQFGNYIESIYTRELLDNCEARNAKNYVPGGGTALLDAIGQTLTEEKTYYLSLPENERPGFVAVVIITDGEENSSRKYNRENIATLTKELENLGWQFVYLGANQNSFNEARNLGLDTATIGNFNAKYIDGGFSNTVNSIGRGMKMSTELRRNYSSYTGVDIREKVAKAMQYTEEEIKSMN